MLDKYYYLLFFCLVIIGTLELYQVTGATTDCINPCNQNPCPCECQNNGKKLVCSNWRKDAGHFLISFINNSVEEVELTGSSPEPILELKPADFVGKRFTKLTITKFDIRNKESRPSPDKTLFEGVSGTLEVLKFKEVKLGVEAHVQSDSESEYYPLFAGINSLKHLYIDYVLQWDNNIGSTGDTGQNEIFRGLDKLETLSMKDNSMKLSSFALKPLVALQKLDISRSCFGTFGHLTDPESILTKLKEFDITNMRTCDGWSNLKLNWGSICSSASVLETIIAKDYQEFNSDLLNGIAQNCASKLKHFDLSHSKLSLASEQFKDFSTFETLNLSRSSILKTDEVPNAFSRLKVTTLDLSSSPIITTVPIGYFNGATIKRLILRNANLTQWPTTLDSLDNGAKVSLTELDIGENPQLTLTSRMFKSLPNLAKLNLANMNLAVLSSEFLDYDNQFTHVDLSYNNLTTLGQDIFKTSNKLLNINLKSNLLTGELDINIPEKVAEIDLRSNRMTTLKKSLLDRIKGHSGLKVRLDGNPLLCNCELKPLNEWLREEAGKAAICRQNPENKCPVCGTEDTVLPALREKELGSMSWTNANDPCSVTTVKADPTTPVTVPPGQSSTAVGSTVTTVKTVEGTTLTASTSVAGIFTLVFALIIGALL